MIKKELEKQRQGEEDNVITFGEDRLKFDPVPPEFDWLRTLPFETRFISKPKGSTSMWYEQYGIGMILPRSVLLAAFADGQLNMRWVDSRKFSKQNELIEIIPQMKEVVENHRKELEKPAGDKDG